MLLPGVALAQGSGAVGPAPTGGGAAGISAFEVTKTARVRVVSVSKDGPLVVRDEQGATVVAKLEKKVAVRADKGTELAGKKKIQLEDLEPGMLLKATYRASDMVVVELRILKEPKRA